MFLQLFGSRGAPYRYVTAPNANHVVTVHGEPEHLLPIARSAWLSVCDSRILRALARLPYKFERERLARDLISGSELLRQWLDDPAATAAELDALALSDEAAGRDERDTILLYR